MRQKKKSVCFLYFLYSVFNTTFLSDINKEQKNLHRTETEITETLIDKLKSLTGKTVLSGPVVYSPGGEINNKKLGPSGGKKTARKISVDERIAGAKTKTVIMTVAIIISIA